MEGEETYTVEEAARVLKRTPGRIRQMLRAGELSGEHEGEDERKPWRVHKWSAHALRDRLQEERAKADRRTPSRSPREPQESPESASELFWVVQPPARARARRRPPRDYRDCGEQPARGSRTRAPAGTGGAG